MEGPSQILALIESVRARWRRLLVFRAVVEAGLLRGELVGLLAPGRDRDEQRARRPLVPAQLAHQVVAAHLRHLDVEQHHVRADVVGDLDRIAAAIGGMHVVALVAQQQGQRVGRVYVVVDHQDLLLHGPIIAR